PKIAVDGVVSSFIGCAGQRCMAASLLVAVGGVDHMLGAILEKARAIKLGSDMWAIIDKDSLSRIHSILDRVAAEGGRIVLDGRQCAPPAQYQGGIWMGPTITEANPEIEAATAEIFGPVITIVRALNLKEAMNLE